MKGIDFLFLALVLPSLFAITLIADGASKILRQESGWVSVGLGIVFLISAISAYFLLIQ